MSQALRTPEPKPLGQRLVDSGLINASQLDLALRQQKRSGNYLGEVLVQLGFVTEEDITASLAVENDVEMVAVRDLVVEPELLNLVSYETARQHKLIPLRFDSGYLTVVFADALNVVGQDAVEREAQHPINIVTAPEAQILEAIERNYARSASINETIEQVLAGDTRDLTSVDDGSPMVRLVDLLLASGIKHKATDIHLHPEEKNLRVRLRVDGILHQEIIAPKAIQSAILARLKLMAGLDITEKRIPQDGRIRYHFGSSHIDMRVSSLPTNHGESIVIRILDGSAVRQSLGQLGFSSADLQRLNSAISNPYGMVLVTGPTGSGKTTTLYTALGTIDRESRSVFTLEDPIEYTLPWVRQTQVNPEVGMDFATGLKALLRQDPDVILVGEIRDTVTAELATRAALTGHLVFSTLHTNNAVGVIPRLIDMGIDRYLLPSALVAIVGQRLLRKLCDKCKVKSRNLSPLLKGSVLAHLAEEDPLHWEPVGCSDCNNTGYHGRIAVYEVLLVDDSFHDAILESASESHLQKLARNAGMTTMLQDGVAKAKLGDTSLTEVLRVLR